MTKPVPSAVTNVSTTCAGAPAPAAHPARAAIIGAMAKTLHADATNGGTRAPRITTRYKRIDHMPVFSCTHQ